MLIYLSAPRNRSTEDRYVDDNEYKRKLEDIGHTVITFTGGTTGREHIIARCDAVVYLVRWNNDANCLYDLAFARMQGLPTYSWTNLPALHPTEVACPEQTVEFLTTVMRMYRMHLAKNADYSPANILGPGMVGVATRIWDKVTRFLNLSGFPLKIKHLKNATQITFYHKIEEPKEPKHESIEDTLIDLAVYSIIALLLKKEKWGR